MGKTLPGSSTPALEGPSSSKVVRKRMKETTGTSDPVAHLLAIRQDSTSTTSAPQDEIQGTEPGDFNHGLLGFASTFLQTSGTLSRSPDKVKAHVPVLLARL